MRRMSRLACLTVCTDGALALAHALVRSFFGVINKALEGVIPSCSLGPGIPRFARIQTERA